MAEEKTETITKLPQFEPQHCSEVVEIWNELSPAEKLLFNEQSIARQQNEFIMEALISGSARFKKHEAELEGLKGAVKVLNDLKLVVTSKWSVIVFLGITLSPVLLIILSIWFNKIFKSVPS